jgi:hypothetical protein
MCVYHGHWLPTWSFRKKHFSFLIKKYFFKGASTMRQNNKSRRLKIAHYISVLFASIALSACGGGSGGGDVSGGTGNSGPALDKGTYLQTSAIVGAAVDDFKNGDELQKTRSIVNDDKVDQCTAEKTGEPMDQFSDQISYNVASMLEPTPVAIGAIGGLYGAPSDDASYHPTSLMSHQLCNVSAASLKKTLKKIPDSATINKMNKFSNEMNELRARANAGDTVAKAELQKKWTKVFSCLSYTESLSSGDSARTRSIAAQVVPDDYERPEGIAFNMDAAQPAVSKLNVGMYQFTPNSTGNIKSCLKAWNAMNAGKQSCQVNASGSQDEMIKLLGSSHQSFNSFCGVHKVVETFAIQAYTKKATATSPANMSGGALKESANRCVTPYFYAGWAYNHFGPLQNSTGANLKELHQCIDSAE